MAFWKLILLFSSCFFGGTAIFFFKHGNTQRLKLILSFSGAYIFAITVLHLMPEVYAGGDETIGVFILAGFIFQIILEQFSEGIEHGHIHHHHTIDQRVIPWGVMLSLCLHAFLEGMPLAQGTHNELVFGIALHHVPAAFALGSVLLQSKVRVSTIMMLLIIFSLMCPLGYFFSDAIGSGLISGINAYFDRIMGVVIGIFLHISTTILFESSVDHRFNTRKMLAVLAGMGIALIGFLLL